MSATLEILLIAILIASSCSILGSYLMLKNMAMVSDAISHTVLLGIVITFFMVHNLSSPFLIVGAGIIGVFTVYLIELLSSTRLLKEDSSIGIIFPFLFSIAVILISKYAGNVHLDIDSVLLGELAFAPLNRMEILGFSLPKSFVAGLIILIINVLFVVIFFKELKISTFDKELAKTLGMRPVIIHYLLISLVSMTSVASFEAVGSVLVIAFMIGPVISAYLLTNKLKSMLTIAVLLSSLSSIIGFYIARILDISIAGTIAVVIGVFFIISFIISPKNYILKRKINK